MKFVLTEKPRYWWPVTVRVPDPDHPGRIIEQQLKVLFEPQDREASIASAEAHLALTSDRARADHEIDLMLNVVRDWDDVEDSDKRPIPFTPEIFRSAVGQSWFRAGVSEAYAESLAGQEARLGN